MYDAASYIYDALPDCADKFTGKERDSESGLDNFGARYNTSSLGRFMQPDPLYLDLRRLWNPQRLNLDAYTVNNPLKFTDSTGLEIDVDGKHKKDYLKALQKNLSFKVKLSHGQVKLARQGGYVEAVGS